MSETLCKCPICRQWVDPAHDATLVYATPPTPEHTTHRSENLNVRGAYFHPACFTQAIGYRKQPRPPTP